MSYPIPRWLSCSFFISSLVLCQGCDSSIRFLSFSLGHKYYNILLQYTILKFLSFPPWFWYADSRFSDFCSNPSNCRHSVWYKEDSDNLMWNEKHFLFLVLAPMDTSLFSWLLILIWSRPEARSGLKVVWKKRKEIWVGSLWPDFLLWFSLNFTFFCIQSSMGLFVEILRRSSNYAEVKM